MLAWISRQGGGQRGAAGLGLRFGVGVPVRVICLILVALSASASGICGPVAAAAAAAATAAGGATVSGAEAAATAGAMAAEKPAAGPLELCVLPYINLEGLLRAYGPLAGYLETALGRPVRVVTARDYSHLVAETARKAYPLLVTASHFARMAELDTGYVPILRPLTTFHELLIVPLASPLQRVEELAGHTVAVPDAMAQTTMMGRRQLRLHGLEPGHDVSLIVARGHLNAVHAVLNGGADAAVVSEGGFRHMKEEVRWQMRELTPNPAWEKQRIEAIPVVYLASPDLPAAERIRLTGLMARFANETPEGRGWIDQLKYEGLRPPSAEEMAANDPFVDDLRRILAKPSPSPRP